MAIALTMALGACGDATTASSSRLTVAFVMVGPRDDLGYNQAVFEGSVEVARRHPDLEILRVENVPESPEAARVMRELVEDQGVDLIFATSFGHLEYAYEVAVEHPEVIFVHQGGKEPEPRLHNFGTYFGSHWEAMYEAGVAAGHATQSGVLGFVAAFPIPATFANVNAFTMGAQRVRPEITTQVAYTADWCEQEAQSLAVANLLAAGADVLALHQDCTTTILQLAEDAGIAGVVGYHADGSEIAATRWLAGAVWMWGDVYSSIVETVLNNDFETSIWTTDQRGSIADGNNPFTLTSPGPIVATATRAEMARVREELTDGATPFTGPRNDNEGAQRIAAGEALTVLEVDSLDWFVAGVTVQ